MSTVVVRPQITPGDRLGFTLCLAILVHAMIVLGVGFSPEPLPKSHASTLEVVLVAERSERAPEDPAALAQQHSQGGGESAARERPSAPLRVPLPADEPVITAAEVPPLAAQLPKEQNAERPLDGKTSSEAEPPLAAQDTERPPIRAAQDRPAPKAQDATEPAPVQAEAPNRPLPSAAKLITSSFALAGVNAELDQKLSARASRPRHKYISASTREYRYAAYMEAWRAKVERIGNLNYPDEARRRNLSGSLLLDVALNPDGGVREITIRKSSGYDILDDAAVRIVELAAPFAPFPDDILKEVDILHVTRTWQFVDSGALATN
jgi:protein TonB